MAASDSLPEQRDMTEKMAEVLPTPAWCGSGAVTWSIPRAQTYWLSSEEVLETG